MAGREVEGAPPKRQRGKRKTIEEQLEELRREETALSLKIAGNKPDAIAREMGIHPRTVYKLISKALGRRADARDARADEMRELLDERYEWLLRKLHPMIERKPGKRGAPPKDPSLGAVYAAVAIFGKQGELHGANRARQLDVTSKGKALKGGGSMPQKLILLVEESGDLEK